MADNFPNLMKNNLNVQAAQQTNLQIYNLQPTNKFRVNSKGSTPRHIMIKCSKTKKILRRAKEKMYQRTAHECTRRLRASFSSETMEAREQWEDIFHLLREKKQLSTNNQILIENIF